jgi:hypothetical protein
MNVAAPQCRRANAAAPEQQDESEQDLDDQRQQDSLNRHRTRSPALMMP